MCRSTSPPCRRAWFLRPPSLPCSCWSTFDPPSSTSPFSMRLEVFRQTLVYPTQDLLQTRKETGPPSLGALIGLLLMGWEARLLHAKTSPRACPAESPGDD